jgi:hypothetical protein
VGVSGWVRVCVCVCVLVSINQQVKTEGLRKVLPFGVEAGDAFSSKWSRSRRSVQ